MRRPRNDNAWGRPPRDRASAVREISGAARTRRSPRCRARTRCRVDVDRRCRDREAVERGVCLAPVFDLAPHDLRVSRLPTLTARRRRSRPTAGSVWHWTIRRRACPSRGSSPCLQSGSWKQPRRPWSLLRRAASRGPRRRPGVFAASADPRRGLESLADRVDHPFLDLVPADRRGTDRARDRVCEARLPRPRRSAHDDEGRRRDLRHVSAGPSTTSRSSSSEKTTVPQFSIASPGSPAAWRRSARIAPPCVTTSTVSPAMRVGDRPRRRRPPARSAPRASRRRGRSRPRASARSPSGKRSATSARVSPDHEPTSISRSAGSSTTGRPRRCADDVRRLARPRRGRSSRPRRCRRRRAGPQARLPVADRVSLSGGSAWPCQRPMRFQSVSPWRARRMSGRGQASRLAPVDLGLAGKVAARHRLEPGDRPRHRDAARRGGRGRRLQRARRRGARRGGRATRTGPGRAHGVVADVTTPDGAAAVVDARRRTFGGLDVVVNNVGGSGARTIDEMDADDLDATSSTGTSSPRSTCHRAALPALRERGGGVDRADRVDLGTRGRGRPELQRREGGRDQPREGDGAATSRRTGSASSASRPARRCFPAGAGSVASVEDPEGMAAFVERELPWGRFGTVDEIADVVDVPRLAARVVGRRHVRRRRRRPVALVLTVGRRCRTKRGPGRRLPWSDGGRRPRIADTFAARVRELEERDAVTRTRSARTRRRGAIAPRSRARSGRRSSAIATGSSTRSRFAG